MYQGKLSIFSGWPGWPSRSSSLAYLVIRKHTPEHAVALLKAQAQTEQCGICIWMEQSGDVEWRCMQNTASFPEGVDHLIRPQGTPKHFDRLSEHKLTSWQDGEMQRRLLEPSEQGKQTRVAVNWRKFFFLHVLSVHVFSETICSAACIDIWPWKLGLRTWNHYLYCLKHSLILSSQLGLKPVSKDMSCWSCKCYASRCLNIKYFPCGIGWTHSNSDHCT